MHQNPSPPEGLEIKIQDQNDSELPSCEQLLVCDQLPACLQGVLATPEQAVIKISIIS